MDFMDADRKAEEIGDKVINFIFQDTFRKGSVFD